VHLPWDRVFGKVNKKHEDYVKYSDFIYEVCSNSIRIGTVVVVHWVGCVCNQS